MQRTFLNGRVTLHGGDALDVLRTMPDACVDSVCTDPPYALVSIVKRFGKEGAAPANGDVYARASAGFMGKQWDTGDVAFNPDFWREVLRVLKPGGHVVAFGGTRTYHRLVCAIEDAGFEIRDQLAWLFGSGFPKSHDVSKGIDKALGAKGGFGEPKSAAHADLIAKKTAMRGAKHEGWSRPWMSDQDAIERTNRQYLPGSNDARQWQGWGTALKPAHEPIVLARKPLEGTVAANVLKHACGALNIDGCRVATEGENFVRPAVYNGKHEGWRRPWMSDPDALARSQTAKDEAAAKAASLGRWPANVIHDGSDEVVGAFPETGVSSGGKGAASGLIDNAGIYGAFSGANKGSNAGGLGDSGSAARFFYSAKADADDRLGSKHPTVKPVDLMQWLVRLVTPRGGLVLDPFAGTGTTGEAAFREGCSAVLIEREAEYQGCIERRMAHVLSGPDARRHAIIKAKGKVEDAGPLFGGAVA